jgi:glycerophosphoryl diester phosphodiesterase
VSRYENRFLDLLKARPDFPAIVAHRGNSSRAPENTIEAARLAWQSGADAWEIDAHLSRDGVPIVLHDDTLTRTTDVAVRFAQDPRATAGYRVCDFDFAEIRSLDAGSWFVEPLGGHRTARWFNQLEHLAPAQAKLYRSGNVQVPSLAEALEFTVAHDWLINIEIKSFPACRSEIVSRVLHLVGRMQIASRVLISSFDHRDLALASTPSRAIALGILIATPLHHTAEYCTNLVGADAVHISTEVIGAASDLYGRRPEARSLRIDLVEELKASGIPLLVYTVNDHGLDSLARHLAELSVAGIFTDDPVAVGSDIRPRRPVGGSV